MKSNSGIHDRTSRMYRGSTVRRVGNVGRWFFSRKPLDSILTLVIVLIFTLIAACSIQRLLRRAPRAGAAHRPPARLSAREQDQIRITVFKYLLRKYRDCGEDIAFVSVYGPSGLRDPSTDVMHALVSPGIVIEPQSSARAWHKAMLRRD